MKRTLLALIATAGILAGAGCGSGSGSSGSPGSPTQVLPLATAPVSFVVKVPASSGSSSSSRKPEYVSAGTTQVQFAVSTDGGTTYGGYQVVPINISDTSECTPSGSDYLCTASFTAPIGNIYVKVNALNDNHNLLSTAIVGPVTIVEGAANTVNVTLNGVVNTLTLALTPGTLSEGTPGTVTATWGGEDAGGYTIVAPGNLVDASGNTITPTLTITDDPGAFGTPTYTPSTYSWAAAYDGSSPIDTPQTFTVSADGFTSVSEPLTISQLPTLSVTPTSIHFLDLTPISITISETGYGSGAFTLTSSNTAIATVPASVNATAGSATVDVSPQAAGTVDTITIKDSYGQQTTVNVSVTTTAGVIQ